LRLGLRLWLANGRRGHADANATDGDDASNRPRDPAQATPHRLPHTCHDPAPTAVPRYGAKVTRFCGFSSDAKAQIADFAESRRRPEPRLALSRCL
jgi:hypothetical protein